jgi:hypothetical protein
MMGDLLVDEDFVYDENGVLVKDEHGDPVVTSQVKVYPIHPDDEIILFQRASQADNGLFGNSGTKPYITQPGGCKCCYGGEAYNPTRTRTIRQKYKHIGCSWTWWPQKYAINGDPAVPACGTSSYASPFDRTNYTPTSNCFFVSENINDGSSDDPAEGLQKEKCQVCTQIHGWFLSAYANTSPGQFFNIFGDVTGNKTAPPAYSNVVIPEGGWLTSAVSYQYPGFPPAFDRDCCSCWSPDPNDPRTNLQRFSSCWNILKAPNYNSTACYGLDIYQNR